MHLRFMVAALAVVLFGFASVAEAQPGGGFAGRGGGGMSMLSLLRIEAVQKELDLSEDQVGQINEVLQEMRSGRAGGGERGEGRQRRRPQAEDESRVAAPNGIQFVAFLQDDADDDRRARFQQMRQQYEERQKEALAKVEKILKPAQLKRLKGIYLQVAGAAALNDPMIAKDLGITEAQREEMAEVRQEAFAGIRELFQGGDRDAIREKMTEVREKVNKDMLAVLTTSQQDMLEKMKGKKFELPEGALRSGFGGRGGPRGGAGGEGRRRPE